jgi:hypothetical protein
MVRVLIESGDATERWGTVGVSPNVVEASWQALVDSMDYKLYKDRRGPIAGVARGRATRLSPRSPRAMRIYLDHNANAPLRPEAREAMVEWLGRAGNPSSAHREGAFARSAVEAARAEIAALIGATPAEIVFTSGATEANNLALRGVAGGLVTTAIEHASVLETGARCSRSGRAARRRRRRSRRARVGGRRARRP